MVAPSPLKELEHASPTVAKQVVGPEQVHVVNAVLWADLDLLQLGTPNLRMRTRNIGERNQYASRMMSKLFKAVLKAQVPVLQSCGVWVRVPGPERIGV